MGTDVKPLPCPFCGWHMVGALTIDGAYLACACERCGARGPFVQASQYTEAEAIEAWNRRAVVFCGIRLTTGSAICGLAQGHAGECGV